MTTNPVLSGVHHVKLPVTDLARSVNWYGRVFGFVVTHEFPDHDGVVRGVAGTVPGLGDTQLTLRVNPEVAKGCVGFDPVSFGVDGQADIESRAAHLDGLGVAHSPVIEASIGWLLVLGGPDGVSLAPVQLGRVRPGPRGAAAAHNSAVYAVRVSVDGRLMTAGGDGAVRIWDVGDDGLTAITTVRTAKPIATGDRTADGTGIAVGGDGGIHLFAIKHTAVTAPGDLL